MEWLDVAVLVLSFGMLLALGVPVAVSIGVSTLLTLLLSVPPEPAVTTLAQRMATGLDSFTLLAIPFFILAGQLIHRGGMARRLIDFARVVVGMLPGGLAHVNVVAAMLFGAISGSAVAAASGIGSAMGPSLRRAGYDRDLAAAVNISAATTGLVIPPSNVLIVYALASGGVSIAALFLAGYLPGLLLGLALMGVVGIRALRGHLPAAERPSGAEGLRRLLAALPGLLLLLLVIGGIVFGVFTPTEAAAVAVLYALVLALAYREIGVRDLPQIVLDAAATTAVVMFLIATSIGMSWLLAYENIPQNLSAALLSLSESPVVLLLLINLILLAVGTFMDMTPAILIFTPIFLPLAVEIGIDPVHFGILMVVNLCVGLCTPPVGSVLFVGCGVAGTSIERVVGPLLPFYLAMVLALLIITYVPALSLWLPGVFGF